MGIVLSTWTGDGRCGYSIDCTRGCCLRQIRWCECASHAPLGSAGQDRCRVTVGATPVVRQGSCPGHLNTRAPLSLSPHARRWKSAQRSRCHFLPHAVGRITSTRRARVRRPPAPAGQAARPAHPVCPRSHLRRRGPCPHHLARRVGSSSCPVCVVGRPAGRGAAGGRWPRRGRPAGHACGHCCPCVRRHPAQHHLSVAAPRVCSHPRGPLRR
mmetsp:Transcript_1358/g.4266  ORF Transcript_1358/g.4266 Transcript_1358/m.4266 type:complete len:213 (-) Transcript_1358:8-646(-)